MEMWRRCSSGRPISFYTTLFSFDAIFSLFDITPLKLIRTAKIGWLARQPNGSHWEWGATQRASQPSPPNGEWKAGELSFRRRQINKSRLHLGFIYIHNNNIMIIVWILCFCFRRDGIEKKIAGGGEPTQNHRFNRTMTPQMMNSLDVNFWNMTRYKTNGWRWIMPWNAFWQLLCDEDQTVPYRGCGFVICGKETALVCH